MKTPIYCALLFVVTFFWASPISSQWHQTFGPDSGVVYALAARDTHLFAGTSVGIFRSVDGNDWTTIDSGLTTKNVWALGVDDTNIFAGTYHGGVFRSTNNGDSWSAASSGLTNDYVWSLAIKWPFVFAGTSGGFFRSANNGGSWYEGNTGFSSPTVNAIAIYGLDLIAGTTGGVYRSTNNGDSWSPSNTGLTNTYISALAISGANLLAGTAAGVFLSTNGGANWSASNTGLTNSNILCLATTAIWLFAGTYGGGVFLSMDEGLSWTAVNDSLPDLRVTSLSSDGSGTNILAGTVGAGVWRRPLSDFITSVDPRPTDIPGTFTLNQNYPNPFNPNTTISFSIPARCYVFLSIYDILGQTVSTLVSEELQAGTYSSNWHTEGLSGGVYYYRLRATQLDGGEVAGYSDTKKLLLLR
jgi:hypothetical protein